MSKKQKRVPGYIAEDAKWRAAEAKKRDGIPQDAILADLSQQAPNNSYGPPLYYRDYEFNCADCGKPQVWTAAQQKWWYEVAKGPIYSGAKRCRACREAVRAAHGGTPRRSQTERRPDVEERDREE
jgi:hypothetical protein